VGDFQVVISTSSVTADPSWNGYLETSLGDSGWTDHRARSGTDPANPISTPTAGSVRLDIESQNTTTSDLYNTFRRSFYVFDTGSNLPSEISISEMSMIIPISSVNSGPGWGQSDLDRLKVVTSQATLQDKSNLTKPDYNIANFGDELADRILWSDLSLAASSFFTYKLNDLAQSFILNGGGQKTVMGALLSWDYDNKPPSWLSNKVASYFGGGGAVSLSINYSTATVSTGDTRRRFELPRTAPAFQPRTAGRRGDSRFQPPFLSGPSQTEALETQVQDFLNEMPPLIMRVTPNPNSNITARVGTLLVDPDANEHNVWYKKVGSSNTGWIPLGFAYNDTGVGSAYASAFDSKAFF